ncbi:MAG: BatD family protein, partial [Thermoanaerobaculia bacterium]
MVMRQILALVLLLAVPTSAAAANTLTVDRRNVRKNEIVTATVTLEGDFARSDDLALPVKNLDLVGEPSISSEFSWTNGETRRTKVFRFRARALDAGPAQVGPLGLDSGGRRETLPAIAIQVADDRAPASNDPEVVLRELLAA